MVVSSFLGFFSPQMNCRKRVPRRQAIDVNVVDLKRECKLLHSKSPEHPSIFCNIVMVSWSASERQGGSLWSLATAGLTSQ